MIKETKTTGGRAYATNYTKREKRTYFRGGGTEALLLTSLSSIDDLPLKAKSRLENLVRDYGDNLRYEEVVKTDELEILIKEGYLEESTNNEKILDVYYSRNDLFMELSKRQYDIQPNTNTTKQQMIEWIVKNSEYLTARLTGKYTIVSYTDNMKEIAWKLKEMLLEIDKRYLYNQENVSLYEFYCTLENEKIFAESDSKVIDRLVRDYREQNKKSKTITLLLCIFGGYFGLHCFYTGKVAQGILYIFTVGVFGIGWIVDIVKIATGKYKDKYGNYLA